MDRWVALYYLLVAAALIFFGVIAWRLYREIRYLITSAPKGELHWADIAFVALLAVACAAIGVGPGFKDLPIGRAVRDLFGH